MILVLAGTMWTPPGGFASLLLPLYLLVRASSGSASPWGRC
ncbi:MAG: hypothetical protein R3F60_27425 [bacterium]